VGEVGKSVTNKSGKNIGVIMLFLIDALSLTTLSFSMGH
jgi:hypothetical protein